jgi:hypothetical protein
MTLKETSFEDAKREFVAFLTDNGLAERILWVFKEDTLSLKTDTYQTGFWLKLPLPDDNEKFAEKYFELGKARGFGVGLVAFASCSEGLCCSFIVPTDQEDAEYFLMSPEHLKYSFVSRDMPVAKVFRNGLVWRILAWFPRFFKPGCHFVYLTTRTDLISDRAA